jgi:hypothetical protein
VDSTTPSTRIFMMRELIIDSVELILTVGEWEAYKTGSYFQAILKIKTADIPNMSSSKASSIFI